MNSGSFLKVRAQASQIKKRKVNRNERVLELQNKGKGEKEMLNLKVRTLILLKLNVSRMC